MEIFGLITAWEVVVVTLLVEVDMQGLVTAMVVGPLLTLLDAAEFVKTETELVEAAVNLAVEFVEAELEAALRAW